MTIAMKLQTRMGRNCFRAIFIATAFALVGTLALAQTVTVRPPSGHPRQSVTVSGTLFGAAEAVDIYFDTADILLGVTDGRGALAPTPITVPPSALPGRHWITVVGRNAGRAAQTALLVSTRWRQHGFESRGIRFNSYENVVNAGNAAQLDVYWQAATNDFVFSSPAVANGVVYAGSLDGNLYAFNARTGAIKWKAKTPFIIWSSPAVANGIVYIGSQSGGLFAFNAANGALKWNAAMAGDVRSPPTIINGVVYVGSRDGNLYAFNATTGALLWSAATRGTIDISSPAVANGVVYVGSYDGLLYVFNAATGKRIWSASTGNFVHSSPAVANGVVYAGSFDDKLYAFNAATGASLWAAVTGGPIESSPAVADGVVYVGSSDAKLHAYALFGGKSRAYRQKSLPPSPTTLVPDKSLKPVPAPANIRNRQEFD